jgi:hypothetical protein
MNSRVELRKHTDEQLVLLYKQVRDETVWEILLLRYEDCIFKLMRKYDVRVVEFRSHPLYTYLVDGVRYALNNYMQPESQKGGKKASFFTFLYSTLENIFIRRFYSNEKFHQAVSRYSINNGEGDTTIDVVPLDTPEPVRARLFNSLDAADKIDKEFSKNFIAGCVMKLHYGVDCKAPYKAAQLQRIVPEYVKLKASGFSLPVAE